MNPHCSVFVCTERGDIVKISRLLIFANKKNFQVYKYVIDKTRSLTRATLQIESIFS
jgi:hypothetical protein